MGRLMETKEARVLWSESGLQFNKLSKPNLQRLRCLVNDQLLKHTVLKEFKCNQRWVFGGQPGQEWATLKCSAFYFENRQCISFEPNGFVGFAGWASSDNVQPILIGFCNWLDEMAVEQLS